MTEIPSEILDRAARAFHKSLHEHEDYATAVADAISVAAPLFAARELRNLAALTWGSAALMAYQRANQLEGRAP